jgi:hypothetical protein
MWKLRQVVKINAIYHTNGLPLIVCNLPYLITLCHKISKDLSWFHSSVSREGRKQYSARSLFRYYIGI